MKTIVMESLRFDGSAPRQYDPFESGHRLIITQTPKFILDRISMADSILQSILLDTNAKDIMRSSKIERGY